ncbi:MotA/TolQ/ExbB proton channel family protein [Ruminococcus flavefaciens]|uniref:MotA/TolQ/ExbB proton channel family protein n=1 Tax=Ruminococcus flavefaciens TaxID=1265 RepID=UPI0026F02C16|nr:MotA/TolQ/ExbB proton channel family protein [Ruminococcus flavefaciens]
MNWQSVGNFVSQIINPLILAFAVFALFLYLKSKKRKDYIEDELIKWEKNDSITGFDENGKIYESYKKLNFVYTLFITLISVFPLLGMLGTVSALLGIDMSSSEAISSAKDSFFYALSSTFLGIICAIVFKLLNAAKLYDIEDIAQRLLKVIKNLRQEGINEEKKQKTWWKYEN